MEALGHRPAASLLPPQPGQFILGKRAVHGHERVITERSGRVNRPFPPAGAQVAVVERLLAGIRAIEQLCPERSPRVPCALGRSSSAGRAPQQAQAPARTSYPSVTPPGTRYFPGDKRLHQFLRTIITTVSLTAFVARDGRIAPIGNVGRKVILRSQAAGSLTASKAGAAAARAAQRPPQGCSPHSTRCHHRRLRSTRQVNSRGRFPFQPWMH